MRLLILTEIAAVILVGYLFLRRDAGTTLPVEGSAVEVAEIKSTKKYENSKFTLEHPNNWSYSKQESNEQEFVFKKYSKTVVSGVLRINVNKMSDLKATYVLPVNVESDSLKLGKISDACSEFFSGKTGIAKYNGTEFNCTTETKQGILILGLIGGDQRIYFPKTSTVTDYFAFTYIDNAINPNFDEAIEILKSFKVIR